MLSATAYKITDSEARAHISLKVDAEKRFSADLYLVIDVSGSMQLPAVLKDRGSEASLLSVLDIVVHSCRTVIHCLSAEDSLGIVTYSDTAHVVLNATRMDEAGKAMAEKALETLRPDGQTSLWQGLETALDLALAPRASLASVLLLTDGVPNVEPTGGHLKALEDYKRCKGLACSIHTFGFGSDLDSELLDGLAKAGGGSYVFIPDAGFLGTALVNSMANTVTSAGRNLRFVLHLEDGSKAHAVGYEVHGDIIDMGSLQLGQSKDWGG